MTVLAAAVVPFPPMLVPALAGDAATELGPLLGACDEAVSGLLAQAQDTVICIGPGDWTTRRRTREWGTLAGYGVAVEAPARHDDGLASLPLSLTIGRWLLDRVGKPGAVVTQEVKTGADPADCARLGRALDEEFPEAVWLVLGDGSNRRGPRSPGHDDPRAPGFDAAVVQALRSGNPGALAAIDAGLAAELGAAGRSAWQVLAGAADHALAGGADRALAGSADRRPAERGAARADAVIHYEAAPFGVEYIVAEWRFGK